MKLFIPVIGSISTGKTTFMKGFLGVDCLETGNNTTTKFVCLIQNSNQTSFYHVFLKRQNEDIIISKDGQEIKDINQIKTKVEELNRNFSIKKASKEELFYMLETPIKNINNPNLLNNCIFMDIPGLNEINTSYIEDIFSIINLKNILFEIIIFDSTSFDSDMTLNIFKAINKKNCLQKEGNLYILNKIDKVTAGGEDSIIKKFKYSFYEKFEKNSNENIFINIYKNNFVPMNSILYTAETKCEYDFLSWLIVELFYCLSHLDKENPSFSEYLEKRLTNIPLKLNIKEDEIEKYSEEVKENDINKITEDIEILKEDILSQTERNNEFTFGINMNDSEVKRIMIKLYILHKKKMLGEYIHSDCYINLQNILSKLTINKEENLDSPPPIKQIIKEYKEDSILKEMNDFLKEKLKNQFKELEKYLKSINEIIFSGRIRISFIGQISVGKSTVLNCIIGSKILPIDIAECTYRGIIIKHDSNLKDFYLYKVKVLTINEHDGLREYTKFEEEPQHFCRGVESIYSYLSTKNTDININDDSEAFLIIKGKLKIFDYIKLEQELIDKIEFVDLPGYDRDKNVFNEKQYYHKILKFSNSCVYINIANNLQTDVSFKRMESQYQGDKSNIFCTLQPKFIDTCLFLINKSDELPKEKDKSIAKNNLINIVSKIEPLAENDHNRINISFFSGKYFYEYLINYERYVKNMDNNPILTLSYLYEKWSSEKSYNKGFKKYITKKIADKIEDNFGKIDEKPTPQDFQNNLKNAFNMLYKNKYKSISSKDEDEIINKLYNIYILYKNKDTSNTKYSGQFFDDLKRMIINAENLQKENFAKNFEAFFQTSDELFKREIKKEKEISEKQAKSVYDLFVNDLIPFCEKVLIEKENIIKNIINSCKNKCINIIDEESYNVEKVLAEYYYDIEKAYNALENKLSENIKNMQQEQEQVANNILEDLKKKVEERIKAYYKAQDLSLEKMNVEMEQTISNFSNIINLSFKAIFIVLGVANELGVVPTSFIGVSLLGVLIGIFGIGGALLIGVIFVAGFFFGRNKEINQYKEILEKAKNNFRSKFYDIEYSFSDHFRTFKDTLISELKIKSEIYLKRVNHDETEWKEIQEKYEVIKKNTLKKAKEKFNFI